MIDKNMEYPYCKDSCNHYKQRGQCSGCGIYEEVEMMQALTKVNKEILEDHATDIQIGGSHYKNYAIQPIEFIVKNNVPYIEGCVIKYIMRHRDKGGVQDLKKARHYIDLLLELKY